MMFNLRTFPFNQYHRFPLSLHFPCSLGGSCHFKMLEGALPVSRCWKGLLTLLFLWASTSFYHNDNGIPGYHDPRARDMHDLGLPF